MHLRSELPGFFFHFRLGQGVAEAYKKVQFSAFATMTIALLKMFDYRERSEERLNTSKV